MFYSCKKHKQWKHRLQQLKSGILRSTNSLLKANTRNLQQKRDSSRNCLRKTARVVSLEFLLFWKFYSRYIVYGCTPTRECHTAKCKIVKIFAGSLPFFQLCSQHRASFCKFHFSETANPFRTNRSLTTELIIVERKLLHCVFCMLRTENGKYNYLPLIFLVCFQDVSICTSVTRISTHIAWTLWNDCKSHTLTSNTGCVESSPWFLVFVG